MTAEPAVTARLDNIEKRMENLSKGLSEMKNARQAEWPALQAGGRPLQQQGSGGQVPGQTGGLPNGGARSKFGGDARLPIGGLGYRARSDSIKRKAEQEEQHT